MRVDIEEYRKTTYDAGIMQNTIKTTNNYGLWELFEFWFLHYTAREYFILWMMARSL